MGEFESGAESCVDAYRISLRKCAPIGIFLMLALAIGIRVALYPLSSPDFGGFLQKWYDHLTWNGFKGLATIDSNYNMPYLYLLYIAGQMHVPALMTVKIISGFFDFVLAYGVMLAVRECRTRDYFPQMAGCAALFLPTVFLNSSMWAQCDCIFTSFLLLSFVQFQRKHYWLGWAFWGLAFIFKLQAAFFLPFPLFLWLADKRSPIFAPIIALLIFIAALIPAWVAGRPALDLLGIYANQATMYFNTLSYSAATFYQWIPNDYYTSFSWVGVGMTAGLVMLAILGALITGRAKSKEEKVVFVTFLLFMVTFFLPYMHERYFYPSEVFALVLAFIRPRMIVAVVLSQILGLFAYSPYLLNNPHPAVPINLLPLGMCGVILLLFYEMFGRQRVDLPIADQPD